MTIQEIMDKTGWKCLGTQNLDTQVDSIFCGDLLSYVMGHGESAQAWITMQTHQNVIAIAALKEFACVILIDDLDPDPDAFDSAKELGIPVLISPLDAFATAKVLVNLGF